MAERSGLFSAALKGFVRSVPHWLITAALVFAGVNASLTVDAGYVILVPLGAVLFAQVGRHPIAGLAAAFAGVSGGFSANLFLTPVDPLLAGLTQEAARLYDKNYVVPATANYYFMIGSTFLLTLIGAAVNNWIVEPRLGAYHASRKQESSLLLPEERRGLMAAGFTVLFEIIVLLFLTLPDNALLRDAKGNLDPFFQGMVVLMSVGFLLPAIAYGLAAGTIKNNRDVGRMIEETFGTMGSYIALAFAASQFVAYFGWSNLGLIFAVTGADLLRASGLSGIPLIVLFIFVCAAIDLICRQRLGEMGGYRTRLRTYAHDHGLLAGAHAGGLPHRRFVYQHHHAAHALYAAGDCVRPEIRAPNRPRNIVDLDASLFRGVRYRLDRACWRFGFFWEFHWAPAPGWSILQRDCLRFMISLFLDFLAAGIHCCSMPGVAIYA